MRAPFQVARWWLLTVLTRRRAERSRTFSHDSHGYQPIYRGSNHMTSSNPNYFSLPTTIRLGGGVAAYEFCGDTDIQSITENKEKMKPIHTFVPRSFLAEAPLPVSCVSLQISLSSQSELILRLCLEGLLSLLEKLVFLSSCEYLKCFNYYLQNKSVSEWCSNLCAHCLCSHRHSERTSALNVKVKLSFDYLQHSQGSTLSGNLCMLY